MAFRANRGRGRRLRCGCRSLRAYTPGGRSLLRREVSWKTPCSIGGFFMPPGKNSSRLFADGAADPAAAIRQSSPGEAHSRLTSGHVQEVDHALRAKRQKYVRTGAGAGGCGLGGRGSGVKRGCAGCSAGSGCSASRTDLTSAGTAGTSIDESGTDQRKAWAKRARASACGCARTDGHKTRADCCCSRTGRCEWSTQRDATGSNCGGRRYTKPDH